MFYYLQFFIILFFTERCVGYNFVAFAKQNSLLQPCHVVDNLGNVNVKDLLLLNLKTVDAGDMETTITNGNITVLNDVPQDNLIELSLEILEWKRGKWEQTIYSIRRHDFCSALFNPSELWYSLTKNTPMEDRICPPVKGTVYHINNLENRIELQNVTFDMEGKFKVVSHIKSGQYVTCITSTVDVWKN